jgi:ubiquinone/menaquinone biosynthesis C-methylase UbiE
VAIRAELLERLVGLAGERLYGDGKVLDVGCGGGWLLDRLTRRGVAQGRLHGVDLIEARVDVARRRLPEADIRNADARALPFPDSEFEVVTLLTCLSSMPDRGSVARALAEATRVLAPDGLLLCYEPRVANPFNPATLHISSSVLRSALGPETASCRLTAFPPLARRLGPLTTRLYPVVARTAPTHTLAAWASTSNAP